MKPKPKVAQSARVLLGRGALIALIVIVLINILSLGAFAAPQFAAQQAIAAAPQAKPKANYGKNCVAWHTVRYGQGLSGIASYYGVNLWTLAQANGIANVNHIYAGQVLCIPGYVQPPPPPQPQPVPQCYGVWYTVQHGDTLNKISWAYGAWIWDIVRCNNLYNANHIYVGQVLVIPNAAPPPPTPPAPPPAPTGAWLSSYYNNKNLEGAPSYETNIAALNLNWGTGGPGYGISNDNFSAIFTRKLSLANAGYYNFFATVDDGIRLYVDGALVIDAWRVQPATSYAGVIYLNAGVHDIRVEFFEESGTASINVNWSRAQ